MSEERTVIETSEPSVRSRSFHRLSRGSLILLLGSHDRRTVSPVSDRFHDEDSERVWPAVRWAIGRFYIVH